MVVISVLTSIFNVINLSILRYITETLMKRATAYFLGVIGVMFLLSVTIAIINGSLKFGIRVEDGTAMKEKIQKSFVTESNTKVFTQFSFVTSQDFIRSYDSLMSSFEMLENTQDSMTCWKRVWLFRI